MLVSLSRPNFLFRTERLVPSFAVLLAAMAFIVGNVSLSIAQVNQPSGAASGNQQPNTIQLTQEQMEAQRKAAEQAYAEYQAEVEAAATRAKQLPPGFPLPQDHADYVGQLLDHWQKTSEQVEAYKCTFQRFDYDTSQVAYRDPTTRQLAAYQVAYGEIRYAAKDKASFETNRVMKFKSPPQTPEGNAEWEPVEGHSSFGKTVHERWICDGTSVFDFDFVGKRMYESEIPPNLRGNVVESPLPFLFGANKQDIMTRYWIRYVPKYRTDANGQKQLVEDEYWLEAYPKTINDARTYSKLEIVLAAKDFMPVSIHMYSPQYDGKSNFESRYFYFQDRQVNNGLAKFQDFFGHFVKPRLPLGWEAVKRNSGQSSTAELPSGNRKN